MVYLLCRIEMLHGMNFALVSILQGVAKRSKDILSVLKFAWENTKESRIALTNVCNGKGQNHWGGSLPEVHLMQKMSP